jgi:hypothetical protein
MAQVDVSHLKAIKSEMLELQPKPDWLTVIRDVGTLVLAGYRILYNNSQWHAPDKLETAILGVLVVNSALAISKAFKARKLKNSTLLALAHLEDEIDQADPDEGKQMLRWNFLSRRASNWQRLIAALWARVFRLVELNPPTIGGSKVQSLPAPGAGGQDPNTADALSSHKKS